MINNRNAQKINFKCAFLSKFLHESVLNKINYQEDQQVDGTFQKSQDHKLQPSQLLTKQLEPEDNHL